MLYRWDQALDLDYAALAPNCVWRVEGSDVKHLLRRERGAITVIEEAHASRRSARVRLTGSPMARVNPAHNRMVRPPSTART